MILLGEIAELTTEAVEGPTLSFGSWGTDFDCFSSRGGSPLEQNDVRGSGDPRREHGSFSPPEELGGTELGADGARRNPSPFTDPLSERNFWPAGVSPSAGGPGLPDSRPTLADAQTQPALFRQPPPTYTGALFVPCVPCVP